MKQVIGRRLSNERGGALPLALFGLVSISLLVTTALVTSSTELAISGAHQDATKALYTAEGGLQAYVARFGTTLQNQAGMGQSLYYPPGGGSQVGISVVSLGSQVLSDNRTLRQYALFARPSSSAGRTVSAIVTQIVPAPVPLDLNITSAMTVGGDLSVNGNAFNVNGQSKACGSAGVEALKLASDSDLQLGNASQYDTRLNRFAGTTDAGTNTTGAPVVVRGGTRTVLVSDVLKGKTIHDIANQVPSTYWRYRVSSPTYTSSWLSTVLSTAGGVAVVDAEGGTISLSPGTYTGILIVLNGSVTISGNITFKGIILSEQNFTLSGSVDIEGALISLAMDGTNVVNDMGDDSSLSNGSIQVNYDKCKVDAATTAYANAVPNGQTPLVRRTVSWLEVVR